MKEFKVEYLDIRDNVYMAQTVRTENIHKALEIAKYIANDEKLKRKVITRSISVLDENEHYVYNMFTKKTEKYY